MTRRNISNCLYLEQLSSFYREVPLLWIGAPTRSHKTNLRGWDMIDWSEKLFISSKLPSLSFLFLAIIAITLIWGNKTCKWLISNLLRLQHQMSLHFKVADIVLVAQLCSGQNVVSLQGRRFPHSRSCLLLLQVKQGASLERKNNVWWVFSVCVSVCVCVCLCVSTEVKLQAQECGGVMTQLKLC